MVVQTVHVAGLQVLVVLVKSQLATALCVVCHHSAYGWHAGMAATTQTTVKQDGVCLTVAVTITSVPVKHNAVKVKINKYSQSSQS